MVALPLWRIMNALLAELRFTYALSLAIAVSSYFYVYTAYISDPLALHQTLGNLPFFVLGAEIKRAAKLEALEVLLANRKLRGLAIAWLSGWW